MYIIKETAHDMRNILVPRLPIFKTLNIQHVVSPVFHKFDSMIKNKCFLVLITILIFMDTTMTFCGT